MVSLESLWLLFSWNVCIFYMLMVLTISHLLHFHCKWGLESDCFPHSLNTLFPVSSLISLQLTPWGMRGLKIAEVILQNKRFAKPFSYFRCLSKNMSPCVKTCVVQLVQHPHQSSCATKSSCQRHPFMCLPKVLLLLKSNEDKSQHFFYTFWETPLFRVFYSCLVFKDSSQLQCWHHTAVGSDPEHFFGGGGLLILAWEYHYCNLQGLHGTVANVPSCARESFPHFAEGLTHPVCVVLVPDLKGKMAGAQPGGTLHNKHTQPGASIPPRHQEFTHPGSLFPAQPFLSQLPWLKTPCKTYSQWCEKGQSREETWAGCDFCLTLWYKLLLHTGCD